MAEQSCCNPSEKHFNCDFYDLAVNFGSGKQVFVVVANVPAPKDDHHRCHINTKAVVDSKFITQSMNRGKITNISKSELIITT